MTYPEVSPFHFALTKLSLRAVDLIVPTSTTAARHIRGRFGVLPERVHAVSWGVERQKFKRATVETRRIVCAKWGIDPNAIVFLNPRRFRPAWGGFVSLEAFMRLASEQPLSHFILFGGLGNEEFTREAKARLEEAGLLSTFTLLEGDTPLEVCAELMSISDVFVSLLGRGDMRSSSVLQAAASGGIPVVSDSEEAREMERNGFAGFFVRPDQVEDVLTTLKSCVRNPERLAEMRARNDVFLAAKEDYAKQMDKLLDLIESVCADYRTR
jgi:glycosyltransferase involved in cell wall biosynthesis